jgi:uncharacterized membrane protein YgcG
MAAGSQSIFPARRDPGWVPTPKTPASAASMRLSHNHTLRVQLAAIAESIVGAAIALAPQASAGGQDDNFLALLDQAGIPAHDNVPSVVEYGHQVCQALDGGESASAVIDTMANYSYAEDPSHDLGQYHRTMVRFVRVSVTAFCPGNQGKLASASGSNGEHRIKLAGLTIPNPPEVPPQPEIKVLVPPVAAPSPLPKQAPPPKQVPPPPKQVPPPPPPEQMPPPPPQEQVPPPPPQAVEPPAAGSGGGAGDGGTGSGGTGSGGNGGAGTGSGGGIPAQPAPRLPEGHIVLAP